MSTSRGENGRRRLQAEDLVTDQTELTDRLNGEIGARRELVTIVVKLGYVTAGLQGGLQKPTGQVLAAVMNAESGAMASSKVPLQIADENAEVKCELASASWSK
jgi:hypothetical protein